eukprot:6963276-Heterocapsa_arctica.AAC.1
MASNKLQNNIFPGHVTNILKRTNGYVNYKRTSEELESYTHIINRRKYNPGTNHNYNIASLLGILHYNIYKGLDEVGEVLHPQVSTMGTGTSTTT